METFWLKEKHADKISTKTSTTCMGLRPVADGKLPQVKKDKDRKNTEELAQTPT